jgi:circadian clock protein KaiC
VVSSFVPSGIEGLDELVGGGLPRGGLIVLAGNPGTGKSIFSAHFLYRGCVDYGESGVYVGFAEDREAFYRNMKAFGFDFEKLEREGRFSFLDLVTMREEAISTIMELIVRKIAELGAKRLVVDSFSAMAQAFRETHDVRIVLHTILGRIVRSMGCTTILVVEVPYGETRIGLGVEEFVADGIIVLKRGLLDGRLFRELEILKMKGVPTPEAEAVLTLKDRFRVFPPFKHKPVEKPQKFKPRVDPPGRFSAGSPDLDELLGGGYPRGSLVLIEVDGRISTPQYHLILLPTAWNFGAQGRGVIIIPSTGVDHTILRREALMGGFTEDDINNLLRICVRYHPGLMPEPYIVAFKGEKLLEDYEKLFGIEQELRARTGQPILHIIGMDTLLGTYGEREILTLLRAHLATTREAGDLRISLLKPGYPRAAEILGAAADIHLKITRELGSVLVYGMKPRTNIYVLEMDTSEGYPMPKLTPVI